MTTKSTTHFGPVFQDWRKFAALRVWEVAALMRDLEPRVLPDITDERGDALDFSFEVRMLTSAVAAGLLSATPHTAAAHSETEITSASLIPWLREQGYTALADGLTVPAPHLGGQKKWTAEQLALLSIYREKHGTKAAAEHFKISTSRIRGLLPGKRAPSRAHDIFNLSNKRP